MKIFSRHISPIFAFLFFLVSIPQVIPEVLAEEVSTVPLQYLSTRHKFKPNPETAAVKRDSGSANDDSEDELAVIEKRGSLVKQRPAGFGNCAPPDIIRKKVSAKSAYVMNAATGEILYSHDADMPGQPASTIKVLTGLISLDSLQTNEKIPVSRRAARMPRSKIYLRQGNSYPANDLINAALLASANDASVALAEKIGGKEKVFARLMTAKAQSMGATSTQCQTASGLTAPDQYTTARDLAVVFKNAMENSQFARKMMRKEVTTRDGKVLRSHNKALWRIVGAVGGKTGYTNAARQTYVGKFQRDNENVIVAFLGSETMWDDVRNLVEYGFDKLEQQKRAATQKTSALVSLVNLDDLNEDKNSLLLSRLK